MRKNVIAGFVVMMLAATFAHAETAPAPAKQKVYALIGAVGDRFTFIQEIPGIGHRFEPYERKTSIIGDNQLKRKVLNGMDKAVAALDPNSKRVFLAFPGNALDSVGMTEIEQTAINDVIGVLKTMGQRREWDKIIVATPAYKSLEFNDTTVRMYGFGVFYQPLKSNLDNFDGLKEGMKQAPGGATNVSTNPGLDFFKGIAHDLDNGERWGVDSTTPDNKSTSNVRFVAPYAFITIWVLDPITLEVIDKQRRYDSIRLFDPDSDAANIRDSLDGSFLTKNTAELMQRSVTAAMKQSAILYPNGVVEVGDVKEGSEEKKVEDKK
jgi:hypothetical protein